jgi:hypothetical protein
VPHTFLPLASTVALSISTNGGVGFSSIPPEEKVGLISLEALVQVLTRRSVPMCSKVSHPGLKSCRGRLSSCRPLFTRHHARDLGLTAPSDGTLITQRFHFAPTPHEYRHILGWYRMIQELHENNVRAICVFDGKVRSAAKQREVRGLAYIPRAYPIFLPLAGQEKTRAKEGDPRSRGNGEGTTITTYPTHAPHCLVRITIRRGERRGRRIIAEYHQGLPSGPMPD